jgi:hypothetical protein
MTAQSSRWKLDIEFIEQGDIYFFYKPKKEAEKVNGINDVSRFYFVLDPEGDAPPRYIVMGNKRLPEFSDGGKTTWGFVQIVGGRGFKTYKTPTATQSKTSSRPAGEGIYAVINHRDHTHLLYSLELPNQIGPVQTSFNIRREANYVFLIRPVATSPKSPDEPFSNFMPAKSNELGKRGTEILLIGVGQDIGRLGIRARADEETIDSADIFSKLEMSIKRHPIESLISGDWA